MGKKGSWLSAIKRVFTPNSKEKLLNGSEKKGVKEKKKWGIGKLRHGEATSFIPLNREPSSVEKILGDAERDHQIKHSSISREHHREPSFATRVPSRVYSREKEQVHSLPSRVQQPQTSSYNSRATPNYHQIAAIKIQTAYRGYMGRRSFRALKGLVRLQGVVRGQSVKRQTMNAMRSMQLLVKVQTQIHSRRIQMMENQALQRQNLHKSDKEQDSSLGRWTLTPSSEAEQQEEWDDSMLTKEEIDARMQRKVEAVIKRERALAYAYSQQLWKGTSKSAHNALLEMRSGGYPWWWNWIERQLPMHATQDVTPQPKNDSTPPNPNSELSARLTPNNYTQPRLGQDILDTSTPKSSKASLAIKAKNPPTLTSRPPQANSSTPLKHVKPKPTQTDFSLSAPLRDDESLTSCPSFSVPNYMVPTVSAKAKVRAQSIPKERSQPSRDSKKRFSFPLTQSIGSLFTGKDSSSQRFSRNHNSMQSIGNLSVDSTLSLPTGIGRKPFKLV
ncbi:IQ-domain 13 [Tasmannia lanceolata]|uniref:IQ-domain 13 n=1 Tax=Tasmannia lanceolata TaxID=3420 RepID=UPI004063CF9E